MHKNMLIATELKTTNYTLSLETDLCVKKFAQNRTTGVPDVPVEKNP
jgi:hypothetical protein